ncbi:MAG: alpha/beta fold hydrolase [Phenylobacterium sp.]
MRINRRRRLNVMVSGEAPATVVFFSGMGGGTFDWRAVQPALAGRARCVSFDYAGMGFSDPGPLPRTSGAAVSDIRAVQKRLKIDPPYHLVGHSIGGMAARLFSFLHPQEVAGLVLVDSSCERQLERWFSPKERVSARREGQKARAKALALAIAGELIPGVEEYKMFVGLPDRKLSAAMNESLHRQRTSPGYLRALSSEMDSFESRSTAELDQARRRLGSLPMAVLTGGRSFDSSEEPGARRQATLEEMHREVATLSTRAVHRTIDSGHMIQLERPEAVIAAVSEILDAIELAKQPDQLPITAAVMM